MLNSKQRTYGTKGNETESDSSEIQPENDPPSSDEDDPMADSDYVPTGMPEHNPRSSMY